MFLSWKIYILENISHFLGSGKLHNMCNFRYVKECHMYFSIKHVKFLTLSGKVK